MTTTLHPGPLGGRQDQLATSYITPIDGLRAIAVLAVVLFHAGVPWISGGFVGVDVFFVISGFLITTLLLRELTTSGRIDIVGFYVRRVRRLLPAFILVLIATLIAAKMFLTPIGEQQLLAEQTVASAAFVSNFYFWRAQTGYFAETADELPLLHTWTLSVEEQFYIVWPLVMVATAWAARRVGASLMRALMAALVAGFVLSFALSIIVTPRKAVMAFYTSPTRAWELAAGALLAALVMQHAHDRIAAGLRGWLVPIGLAFILASFAFYSQRTAIPGYAALAPVLGSVAVITGFITAPESPATRFLAAPPFTGIGRLSYSWYLWHWPLLAFARAMAPVHDHMWRDIGLVVVALGLSALTYRFVEQPMRHGKTWPLETRRSTLVAGAALLAMTAALGGLVAVSANSTVANSALLTALKTAKWQTFDKRLACEMIDFDNNGLGPIDGCILGHPGAKPFVLLWGDSNAAHFSPAMDTYAKASGAGVVVYAMGGCRPFLHDLAATAGKQNGRVSASACVHFNHSVAARLDELQQRGLRVVVLSARWSLPAYDGAPAEAWIDQQIALVKSLRRRGLRVVLFPEIPNHPHRVPDCIARRSAQACEVDHAVSELELASPRAVLNAIAKTQTGVTVWDPTDHICVGKRCPLILDGEIVYADWQHLSVGMSRKLAPAIGKVLDEALRTGQH